jgi:hypothetical protein
MWSQSWSQIRNRVGDRIWSHDRRRRGALSRAFAEEGETLRAFGWGAGGVVFGLLFWHIAGYTEIFSDGKPIPVVDRVAAVEQPAPDEGGCTTLALDRQSGRTQQHPCQAPGAVPTLTAKLGEPPPPPFRPAGETAR